MQKNLINKLKLKTYESNQALGNFGPVPYGSVELSEQMQKIGQNIIKKYQKICNEKAYLDYRFGKIHLSNSIFKMLLSQSEGQSTKSKSFLLLGLAATASLQRDYAESNEILYSLEKRKSFLKYETKALSFWRCKNYLGLMLYEDLKKFLGSIPSERASWFLIELYLKSKNIDLDFAIKLVKKWNLKIDSSYTSIKNLFKLGILKQESAKNLFTSVGFSLDHHSMLIYLDKFGLKKFLKSWVETTRGIPYTSELIAAISLFSIKNGGPKLLCDFYNANRIKYLGNIQIPKSIRDQLVYDSITYQDVVRDFNTSNFGGRSYTLNLSKSKIFSFKYLQKTIENTIKESHENLKSILVDHLKPKSFDFSTWFDASFTSGGSNIFPHLHTGGNTRSYYITAVYYAQIPSDIKIGEGDLIFSDTDIVNDKYRRTPITKRIAVKTGDLYAFPSYIFHSTTPSFTKYVRLTFNFDFFTNKTTFNL